MSLSEPQPKGFSYMYTSRETPFTVPFSLLHVISVFGTDSSRLQSHCPFSSQPDDPDPDLTNLMTEVDLF